jgi:hypothetical protein
VGADSLSVISVGDLVNKGKQFRLVSSVFFELSSVVFELSSVVFELSSVVFEVRTVSVSFAIFGTS